MPCAGSHNGSYNCSIPVMLASGHSSRLRQMPTDRSQAPSSSEMLVRVVDRSSTPLLYIVQMYPIQVCAYPQQLAMACMLQAQLACRCRGRHHAAVPDVYRKRCTAVAEVATVLHRPVNVEAAGKSANFASQVRSSFAFLSFVCRCPIHVQAFAQFLNLCNTFCGIQGKLDLAHM